MANTQVEVIIRLEPEQIQRRIIQAGEQLVGSRITDLSSLNDVRKK